MDSTRATSSERCWTLREEHEKQTGLDRQCGGIRYLWLGLVRRAGLVLQVLGDRAGHQPIHGPPLRGIHAWAHGHLMAGAESAEYPGATRHLGGLSCWLGPHRRPQSIWCAG